MWTCIISLSIYCISVAYFVAAQPVDLKTLCPSFVTRSQWHAAPPRNITILPIQPASLVVIHHTATTACQTSAACSLAVRNIQHFHMNTNLWWDIGYNFLIGGDGYVYEGRGWDIQGAHATVVNNRSVGIALVGSFGDSFPTANARQAAQQLIECGVAAGYLSANCQLMGHRQVPTATKCPGDTLFAEIQGWSHFKRQPTRLRKPKARGLSRASSSSGE